MRYISTRGLAPARDFAGVLLAGLAEDGGLFVPDACPRFTADELRALGGKPYAELAAAIMTPFLGDAIAPEKFAQLCEDAYGAFDHAAVAPLTQLDQRSWLLELFHGPTLSFKDYALQLVGHLFEHVLRERGERITIVGATSGDTGSAAIAACAGRAAIDIFILHPQGRVSEVQRRQMTTVDAPNVHNIAIEGTFDDCQDLVKAMFADSGFRAALNLSAVNSINWARIMAQTVYYFAAALALGAPDRDVAFAVPTGNFGNVFAGYMARKMGLPIARLVVGSNRNDILTRFFTARDMSVRPVEPSLSPAMDIQVSSNFERLLFDLYGGDGGRVAESLSGFRQNGRLAVDEAVWRAAGEIFAASRLDDDGTENMIRETHAATGLTIDPHTAVGVHAGRDWARAVDAPADIPLISIATAHPAKFPDAVARATGARPALPARLEDLMIRPERCITLGNDLAAVEAHIRAASTARGAA